MAALQCDICGGKLMGRPGGIFECDSCGMQYDTAWAKAKIQEIKGTVQVEGTVDVKGTVKIDGPVEVKGRANLESLLKRGRLALEDRDWESAEIVFAEALKINAECAEAYFALAMCQAKVNKLEALVQIHHWDNSNYRRGKQFADASLRNQVETYEQSYSRRKKEEEEQARIAQEAKEKQEEAERIAREKQAEAERIAREKQAEENRKHEAEEYIVRVRKMKAARERYEKVRYRIAGDYSYIVGLKEDGTVLSSVEPNYFFGAYDVSAWRNIVALDASDTHVVGLKSDGTVVTTRSWTKEAVERWTDMIAVAAGHFFTAGLKANGTVQVDKDRYCKAKLDRVSRWKNIVEISARDNSLWGLDSNGVMYCSGYDSVEQDVVALTRSGNGLKADGSVASEFSKNMRDILDVDHAICCGSAALKADGTVSYYRYGASQQLENEKNIVAITSYSNGCVGLKANGTIVVDSAYDKCKDWKLFVHIDHLKSYKELLAEGRIARERREAGLCQHCGGSFKGLLGKKCTSCGKSKDYW